MALAQARAILAQAEATFAAENPSVSMTETVNQTSLSSAEADVASAQSGLVAADREIKQLTAQLELARANARNAVTEKERADKLGKSGSISQAEVDRLDTTAEAANANVAAVTAALAGAQARYAQAQAHITSSRSRTTELRANAPLQIDVRKATVGAREASVALARAQLRQAELNLGYTKILAPVAGIVGRKSVSLGDRVQPGQQIAAISRVDDLWVTANFRETQIRDMKPGQRAEVKIDALEVTLHATVESIGGATGSKFSLFPPENAAGNYVKVVQRIPIRIQLDPGQPGLDRMRPGMSVEPKVLVRMTRRGAGALPVGASGPPASRGRCPGEARSPSYFQTGWTGGKNPWAIALVVTMATFMEVLDTSIANVSLPHIAGDLSVSIDESTWVLTSYLVANAIVLPISGWLASRFGRKRFYMTCVALFTISSFLCGTAPTLPWLVFFRILQGMGGGGLGPSEQSILADTFPPQKRGQAFAMYGMAVVLAPAVGPTLGGFITDHFSWRWVFFINVPVGIISMFLSSRMVTDPPHVTAAVERAKRGEGGGVDFIGLGLIAVGLGALELVLDKGQEEDWFHSHFIIGCALVAAVMLTTFVVWEWQHPHPIVDVKLFKSRSFALSNLMMMVLGISLYGTTVLLPQFTQTMMGYSAQDAGMALSPGGFTVMLLMPLVGMLISRVDARKMLAFGFAALSLSLFYMSHTLYTGVDFPTVVKLRVFQSVGLAFLFVPINTLSYVGIPQEKNNAVSGIVNLSRNMGGDIGIALVTTLLARRSQMHQANLSGYADPFHAAYDGRVSALSHALAARGTPAADANHKAMGIVYRQLQMQAMTLSYVDVLYLLGIGTMCMLPLLLLMRKNTGRAQMGH